MVTLHTNHGDIVVETFDEKAPGTVQNFLAYCRSCFYDNTIFHRVIKGFMIQGGGFEPGMTHESLDNAMKNCVVVEARATIVQKILDRSRGFFIESLYNNVAVIRMQSDHHCPLRREI